MTSRWMVDTVAWLVNGVGRKRRGNGRGTWLVHARVRLSSKPIFISFYWEWRHRRHAMSARGLRICSHVWRMDEIRCVSSLPRMWRCRGFAVETAAGAPGHVHDRDLSAMAERPWDGAALWRRRCSIVSAPPGQEPDCCPPDSAR